MIRFSRRISPVLLAFFPLAPALFGSPVPSPIVNDGANADNLIQLSSTNSDGDAVLSLTPNGNGSLTAAQSGDAFFADRTVWYANNVSPTGVVYTVSADFQPAAPANPNRGGVLGWLNLATGKGIALQVRPTETDSSFRLSVVDFTADSGEANESVTNLFNVNGTPASEDLNSAWSSTDPYDPARFATFQLEFTPPSSADQQARSNATAHIFGKVFQTSLSDSNAIRQVGTTIELLTDLPQPLAANHRFGYYAFWGSVVFSGDVIGNLDNLTASGNVQSIANTPPTVRITSPLPGASFPLDTDVIVQADASDREGPIARVEFFVDDALIGTDTTSPFAATVSNLTAGQHTLRARAVDALGSSAGSPPVSITVRPPGPTEGPSLQIQLNADNSVTINWPAGFEDFRLEGSSNLLPGNWATVQKSSPSSANIGPTEAAQFFRLVSP